MMSDLREHMRFLTRVISERVEEGNMEGVISMATHLACVAAKHGVVAKDPERTRRRVRDALNKTTRIEEIVTMASIVGAKVE